MYRRELLGSESFCNLLIELLLRCEIKNLFQLIKYFSSQI
jgi:hypothetical protein